MENEVEILSKIKSNDEKIIEIKKLAENLYNEHPGQTVSSVIWYMDKVKELCNKIEELENIIL